MDKIVCLGKNYLDHAKEMGGKIPEKPVIFLKPPSVMRTVSQSDETPTLQIPSDAGELHYECEIVLRLDKGGYKVSVREAERMIGAVTLGLDMTLRDKQKLAKENGAPWTTAKVFVDSAVIGPWTRLSEFPDYLNQKFSFALDDIERQASFGKDMRMSPAECVSYASEFFPLVAGDLIFTGTPAGVGPVQAGARGTLSWGALRYSVLWKNETPSGK